ncbi:MULTISPECIES: ABC transporter ATP-binding protein [Tessaracoccus]|uniref:ABC transporter ATP-binding protein n=2 Tax=Tessaracoccus TaxID=72763 RepID=A0ABY8PW62_9ACTN|nr:MULTISPECIES: ABC transporter ATP-binding protein [Tessaracoccus]QXT63451.1 ABC transporter ATP-binding protein [Tessaracoccus palaemonis]WGT46699.1 ABC transporter ATP-binding protein [Tessaracoccus sp. T21]
MPTDLPSRADLDLSIDLPDDAVAHALQFVEPVVGAAKPLPILTARNVTRSFGGIKAVDVEHVEFQKGAITALIGPNGAGKTTFFNLLTGFDKADSGEWTFDRSVSLTNKSAAYVARKGVVRTFQLTKALSRLTVLDNMLLAATGQTGERFLPSLIKPLWRGQEKANTERALEILSRFKLDAKAADFAGSLSGGQRKLLEMARALMTDPQVIMLDEPMAGVNPALVQSLLGHIQALRDEGMTVVFVEHDMHAVRHISEWVVVMAEGRVVAEGPPENIMENQAVVDAYLGARHDVDLGDDSLIDPDQLAKLMEVRQRDLAEQKR